MQSHFNPHTEDPPLTSPHLLSQVPLAQGCAAVCMSECVSAWAGASGAMSDPRDIDEDAILKGLSAEELERLENELQELDPEVQGSAWFVFTCQVVCFWLLSPRLRRSHLVAWGSQILQVFVSRGGETVFINLRCSLLTVSKTKTSRIQESKHERCYQFYLILMSLLQWAHLRFDLLHKQSEHKDKRAIEVWNQEGVSTSKVLA